LPGKHAFAMQAWSLYVMTGRKLPPLLVGRCYTCPPLGNVDVTPPDLDREINGETTGVLRLTTTNGVSLAFPVRAFQLQMLMASLMRAFPQQARVNLRLCEERSGSDNASDRTRGARKS
jgi:hypothetical protein